MSSRATNTETEPRIFDGKMKMTAYILAAIIMGTLPGLEDFLDDDRQLKDLWLGMLLTPLFLTAIFPLVGIVVRFCWKFFGRWFRNKKTGTSVISIALCLLVPVLVMSIAPGTFGNALWPEGINTLLFMAITLTVEGFELVLVQRQQLERQNYRLLKAHGEAKYQALINQINPHFLFNSLNALSHLVHKDADKAEHFIEELSRIYRYILQLNETFLVPLRQEVEFIESYLFLQKIRFRDNLDMRINLNPRTLDKCVPPLTLELLVENAVKHNEVSESHPLVVELYAQGNTLIVENRIRLREDYRSDTTKIGLKNLMEKFEILDEKLPEFITENGKFIAKIPLFDPEI
ncbi:hypothetical protein FUAX_07370 [Fulvitalea axinellae]|uniref:Signal transduction histidine kinase internal region domain-containing protein n=1 Tax=Fulvitalea axinellae TaxID=1182444 RepID=A0AAU9DBW0_9BACT|nr:hypothetical protein FUAX_07370 [Fulvitalea axinellae]